MSFQKLGTVVSTSLLLVGNVGANILWDPVGKTCDSIGQALGQTVSNAAVAKLWSDVENLATYAYFAAALSAMKTVSATDYVYMMCDDTYMFHTAADGSMTWNTPHDQTQNIPQSFSQLTCTKGNSGGNLIAYRICWPVRNAQYPAYVVMCARYNSGDIYLDQLNFEAGHSLDDYNTLTTTLFHEFLHVLIPSMRGDMTGGTAAGGERYKVLGTQEVRRTYAPENPDSITLFALALAADNCFWLTTHAESKLDVWRRFKAQGQVGEKMIQALGLAQP
ncbi:hypothetical protein EDB81DRAFT_860119 [Dactylonectria macrodidyma]|uniref:Lysine-specific metallo-endopeptidase domain-containing protein n=1 Tax=Dactylonectria macrodidyma TaxID=307937 RepID=A0A9P9E0J1_9HYPO|nr:hypothetical protein EDB81DRAFT_860119 [Dactylonectria macrodidyma]